MKTRRRSRRSIGLIAIAILMADCGKKDVEEDDLISGPGQQPRALSIRIDGPARVLKLASARFQVLQTWSDGSTLDVTAAATLTSSNPAVLSISAGLGTGLDAGEVGLTANIGGFATQRKTVFVVPPTPEWNGAYRLTIGGGVCTGSLPPELKQRSYSASVEQYELSLAVQVTTFGAIAGRIFNPEVAFYLANPSRTVARGRMRPVATRRAAYWGPPDTSIVEPLPDGNRLVIVGGAVAPMSPSGFTGTLNGSLTLYERNTWNQLAVCSSPSHAFTLTRS